MIVSELIEELKKCPEDQKVLGRGYESGYNEIEAVFPNILVKCNTPWYDGRYQELETKPNKQVDEPKEYICLI